MKTTIALIILGMTVGAPIGAIIQDHATRPTIVRNGGAYYDMHTGAFTWGPAPALATAREAMPKQAADRALAPAFTATKTAGFTDLLARIGAGQ